MADANFRRILIAVGAGDTSVQAARVGLDLAKAIGAETAILHVVEPLTSPSSPIGIPAGELVQVVEQEEDTVLAALERALVLPPSTLQFVHVGHPPEIVDRVAKDWTADLIVVGCHDGGGFSRALLGSVADKIIRHASCPVLVVRKVP